MTEETKWEKVSREIKERVATQFVGRTVVSVKATDDSLEMVFDDGSGLEVCSAIVQRKISDTTIMCYQPWEPGTHEVKLQ